MKLYHGTTERVALKAITEGLKPRGERPSVWKDAPSSPDAVYLTDTYAAYYGIAAIPKRKLKGSGDQRVGIVEIDTDLLPLPGLLVPDEDAVEQTSREKETMLTREAMLQRTGHFRDRLSCYIGGLAWKQSLAAMGTCAHLGRIPPEAITRVATFGLRASAQIAMCAIDAMPSVRAFGVAGYQHRELIAHIFGDARPEPVDALGANIPTIINRWDWLQRGGRPGCEVITAAQARAKRERVNGAA